MQRSECKDTLGLPNGKDRCSLELKTDKADVSCLPRFTDADRAALTDFYSYPQLLEYKLRNQNKAVSSCINVIRNWIIESSNVICTQCLLQEKLEGAVWPEGRSVPTRPFWCVLWIVVAVTVAIVTCAIVTLYCNPHVQDDDYVKVRAPISYYCK